MKTMTRELRRGEIYLVNLGENDGTSIQKGVCRPCVIVSNDMANMYSPVIHVVPLTSKTKNSLPTHVEIGTESGLQMTSIALIEQNMLVDKKAIIKKIGEVDSKAIKKIDIALLVQFGLLEKVKRLVNRAKVAV